jgi:hypothetical protein
VGIGHNNEPLGHCRNIQQAFAIAFDEHFAGQKRLFGALIITLSSA